MRQLRANFKKRKPPQSFFCHFYYLNLSLPFFIKNMPNVVKSVKGNSDLA